VNDVAVQAATESAFTAVAGQISGDLPSIVAVWEEFRSRHDDLLRAELSSSREQFLNDSLRQAHDSGRLFPLLQRLRDANLTLPGLDAAANPLLGARNRLQSYVNGAWASQDALVSGRRMIQACDHVCHISVKGSHSGTGVLIRPNLVVTAAHVVESLVNAEKKQKPGSVGKLKISFFDADDLKDDGSVTAAQPALATLHEDWLVFYSPPAPVDGRQNIDDVTGISASAGPWDFALIRLAAPPRAGLRGYQLCPDDPPDVTFGMHVLHHPATPGGAPERLLWSIGDMKRALGIGEKPVRWLHDANTDKGSSGAPCFDNTWRLVAIHQAGSDSVQTLNQSNRAVPVYGWAKDVDTLAQQRDVTPYLSFVTDETRVGTPVFGRRLLQSRAWSAMTSRLLLAPEQRVFLVLGEPGTGKSFTTAILATLAHEAGCTLVSLDVRNAGNVSPLAFAQMIVGVTGAARVEEPGGLAGLTTELRDVRNEIVPRLGQSLEKLAQERPFWLVLDGLDICDTAAQGVAQVIDGMAATLAQFPHLHIVLIGWKSPVRTDFAEVLPDQPSSSDIVDHLLLTVAPPGMEVPAATRTVLEQMVLGTLNQHPLDKPYARAIAAANATRDVVRALFVTLLSVQGAAGEAG